MNWVLTITFAMLTAANYFLSGKKILFPSVIVCGMFLLSSLFAAINSKWGIQIQLATYLILIFSIIFFSIGCLLGRGKIIVIGEKKRKAVSYFDVTKINMPKAMTFLVCLVCLAVSFFYFLHQLSLSFVYGNTNGLSGMIGTLRKAMVNDTDVARLGIALNLGISFTRAAGITSLYIIISNVIEKRRIKIFTLLPVICLLINSVLATGRGALIMIVTTIIYDIYVINYLKNNKKINGKIIRYGILLFFVFITIFWALGTLTGTSKVLNFWDTLSIYIGSPIVCIDNLIKKGWDISSTFGIHTFKGIYNMLSSFGFDISFISNHEEMFRWSTYSSNIYTALYPNLLDFGVLGTFFMQLVLGFLNGTVWSKYTNINAVTNFLLITYGRFFGSALVYYSIAERFCSNWLALNAIAEMGFYFIIIKYFIDKRHFTPSINS